jgi:hypothetical protein
MGDQDKLWEIVSHLAEGYKIFVEDKLEQAARHHIRRYVFVVLPKEVDPIVPLTVRVRLRNLFEL